MASILKTDLNLLPMTSNHDLNMVVTIKSLSLMRTLIDANGRNFGNRCMTSSVFTQKI